MNIRIIATLLLCFSLSMAWGQGNITRNKPKEATQKSFSATPKKTSSSTHQKSTPKAQPKKTPSVPAPVLGTSSYTPAVKTFTVKGITFEMVEVRGGTFRMGATSDQGSETWTIEEPVHSVTLSDYYIGKTEVTQELWQAVMGTTVQQQRDKVSKTWKLSGVGKEHPIYYISYKECQEFVSKLNSLTGRNFRLPTEAEWEFACRGGSKSKGYKYSGSNNIDQVAWCESNSGNSTHEVGQKSPNEIGIYDMSGNVEEWCNDRYGDYSSNAQTNPAGPDSGFKRVFRGGSYSDSDGHCRSSFRADSDPDVWRSTALGFRLALSE